MAQKRKRGRGRPRGSAHLSTRLAPPKEFDGKSIRDLRAILATINRKNQPVSQGVLAQIMGVSRMTISQWEREQARPPGPARRLMEFLPQLVATEPEMLVPYIRISDPSMGKGGFRPEDMVTLRKAMQPTTKKGQPKKRRTAPKRKTRRS